MNNTFNTIIRKALVVILPVPLLMLIAYIAIDPFGQLYGNERVYRPLDSEDDVWLDINYSRESMENFQRYNPRDSFNTFILGSSITYVVSADELAKRIDGARPFHFWSPMQSIHSLMLELKYLESNGADLSHVLVVLAPNAFSLTEPEMSTVAILPPGINPDMTWPEYHWLYLKSFYNREMFKTYSVSKIMGRPVDGVSMVNDIKRPMQVLNPETMEMSLYYMDSLLRHDPVAYSDMIKNRIPHDRTIHELPSNSNADNIADIAEIANILQRSSDDYRVMIAPSWGKDVPHHDDLAVLRKYFGDHLYDFSRSLSWTADCDTLYIDRQHFRAPLATMMMDSVYGQPIF